VAWEGLIDALIQHEETSKSNCTEDFTDEVKRIINLTLKPVLGILKSKCDSTVHLQCLNTWSYLLQKVNISVYSLTVINTHCFPIFELVFKFAPDIQSIPLWNFCFDILEDEKSTSGQWVSWNIGRTDFFLKMVSAMISHTLIENLESDIKDLAHNAALRIFRLVLKGIQNIYRNSSPTISKTKGLKSCLNATLTFVKKICENSPQFSLQLLESFIEELEDTVLESSQSIQFKLPLNFMNIDSFGSVSEFPDDTDWVRLMDNVAVLFFGVLYKSPETKSIERWTFEKLKLPAYLCNPEKLVNIGFRLLRANPSFNGLSIWVITANILECCIDMDICRDILSQIPPEFDIDQNLYMLCNPFTVIQKENKIDIELVIQVGKSLYKTVLRASIRYSSRSFLEDLSRMLTEILDKSTDNFIPGVNRFVILSKHILIYVLNSDDGKIEIDNRFRFASRLVPISYFKIHNAFCTK
jgi:telomere-associated protein RIF1